MTPLESAHFSLALDTALYAAGCDPRRVVYSFDGPIWKRVTPHDEQWGTLDQLRAREGELDHAGIQAYLGSLYAEVQRLEASEDPTPTP